jgi:hypothetical protein
MPFYKLQPADGQDRPFPHHTLSPVAIGGVLYARQSLWRVVGSEPPDEERWEAVLIVQSIPRS